MKNKKKTHVQSCTLSEFIMEVEHHLFVEENDHLRGHAIRFHDSPREREQIQYRRALLSAPLFLKIIAEH